MRIVKCFCTFSNLPHVFFFLLISETKLTQTTSGSPWEQLRAAVCSFCVPLRLNVRTGQPRASSSINYILESLNITVYRSSSNIIRCFIVVVLFWVNTFNINLFVGIKMSKNKKTPKTNPGLIKLYNKIKQRKHWTLPHFFLSLSLKSGSNDWSHHYSTIEFLLYMYWFTDLHSFNQWRSTHISDSVLTIYR